jgi:hypothetical protein
MMFVNGRQQASSDERHDTSLYASVHSSKNSSVTVNGTVIGSNVSDGHLATVVFNSKSDLKRPKIFRCEAVSDRLQLRWINH